MKTIEIDNVGSRVEFVKNLANEKFYNGANYSYTQPYIFDRLNDGITRCLLMASGLGSTTAIIVKMTENEDVGLLQREGQSVSVQNIQMSLRYCSVYASTNYVYVCFWGMDNHSNIRIDVYRRGRTAYSSSFDPHASRVYSYSYLSTSLPILFFEKENKLWLYTEPRGTDQKIFAMNITDGGGLTEISGISGAYGIYVMSSDGNRLFYLIYNRLYLLDKATAPFHFTLGNVNFTVGGFIHDYLGLGILYSYNEYGCMKLVVNARTGENTSGLFCIWIPSPGSFIDFLDYPFIQVCNEPVIMPPNPASFLNSPNYENNLIPVLTHNRKKVYWISIDSGAFYKLYNRNDISINTGDGTFFVSMPNYIYISGKFIGSGDNKIHRINAPSISKVQFNAMGVIPYAFNESEFDLNTDYKFDPSSIYPLYDNDYNFLVWGQVKYRKNQNDRWVYRMLIPPRFILNQTLIRGLKMIATSSIEMLQSTFLEFSMFMNPYILPQTLFWGGYENVDLADFTSGINIIKIYQIKTGKPVVFLNKYEDLYKDNDTSGGTYTITNLLSEIECPEDCIEVIEQNVSKYILYGSSSSVKITKKVSSFGVVLEMSFPWVFSQTSLQRIADTLGAISRVVKFRCASRNHQFQQNRKYRFNFNNLNNDIRFKILNFDGSGTYSADFWCKDVKYDIATETYSYLFTNPMFSDMYIKRPLEQRLNETNQNANNYVSEGLKFYVDQRYTKTSTDYQANASSSVEIRFNFSNNTIWRSIISGWITNESNNLDSVFVPSDATAVLVRVIVKWNSTNTTHNYALLTSPKYSAYLHAIYPTGVSGAYSSAMVPVPLTPNTTNSLNSFLFYLNTISGNHEFYINFLGWYK